MRRLIVRVVLVLVIVGAAFGVQRLRKLSRIGVGYAAEQTCACVFVSERPLSSCTGELDPLAQRLVTVDKGDNEIRAHVPLFASARARYQPGFGCALID